MLMGGCIADLAILRVCTGQGVDLASEGRKDGFFGNFSLQ